MDWQDDANPWTVKATRRVRENAFFAVEVNTVIAPDGKTRDYDVMRARRFGVGVLAIEAEGWVHLVGQWRFPLARYSWELPAGGAQEGEDALACARRELGEESGLIGGEWRRVIELDLSASLTDERGAGFIVWGFQKSAPHAEAREVLKRKRAHFLEVIDGVADGHIREALSVALILRAYHLAVSGRLPERIAAALLHKPI